MYRITNNLFESIKEVISVDKEKEPVLLNEKVEELDELKKSTLGNYIKRASGDAVNKMHDASAYASIATNAQKTDAPSKEWMSAAHKLSNKAQSRLKGIDKATDKLTKEEAEKIDKRGVAEDSEVDEATDVTDYNPKSQGGTRKELLAKYRKTKDSKDAAAARKAGATQKELQGEEVELDEEKMYYSLVHKTTKKVKSTHTNLDSAKEEHKSMEPGVRAHYYVATSTKNPMKEEQELEEQGMAEGKYNFSSGSYSKRREMGHELGHEDRPGFDPRKYAKMLQKRIDARGGTRGPVGTPEYHKITPFEKPKNEENENFTDNTFKENNMRNNKKTVVEFVIENIIEIEIPDNLTYQDYIDAIQTIIDTDDEDAQTDILTIANEAFKNKEISVIAEAELIRKGILETYKATKSGEKEYSPQLKMDIDRSKPGVTKVSRRIEAGVGQGTTATERRTMKRIASRNK